MGKHSIKTGFEGRFYYVKTRTPTAPRPTTSTRRRRTCRVRYADRPRLRQFPAGRGADIQSAGPGRQHRLLPEQLRLLRAGRLQGDFEADAEPRRALADPAGHVREKRLRHQPRSDAAQHRGGQSAWRVAVRREGRQRRRSSIPTTSRSSRASALPTRCRRRWRSAPATAPATGPPRRTATTTDSADSNSTGYNANISITRATRPTPNSQDPVMFLSEAYPTFTAPFPNYDPNQLNNQGVGTVLTGVEAKREQYNNYNVTVRRQLPANFSTTVAYIGAYGTRAAVRQRDQPRPVRRNRRSTATCCSATCRRSRDSAFRCRTRASPERCSRRCGPTRSSPASPI